MHVFWRKALGLRPPALHSVVYAAIYGGMMNRGFRWMVAVLWALFFGISPLQAENPPDPPDFKEVYDLVRTHVAGLTQPQLDQAAVQALVSALAPRVMLIDKDAGSHESGALLTKTSLFDGDITYLRISQVAPGLAEAVRKQCVSVAATNKINGIVLDLRFTPGTDYAAAAGVAELFVAKDRPLLNWGNGVVRSKAKSDALTFPVAVLVNHQTAGAAEALAAVLRETGVGLILGSRTAGQAMIAQDFPLKNGQVLRIATAPIQLGDGSSLGPEGLKPDINVRVTADNERIYYADAFRVISSTNLLASANLSLTNLDGGTNRTRRARINEAELVRERREGTPLEGTLPARRDRESEKPSVQDPALARALDLLKGLAVVRQSRS